MEIDLNRLQSQALSQLHLHCLNPLLITANITSSCLLNCSKNTAGGSLDEFTDYVKLHIPVTALKNVFEMLYITYIIFCAFVFPRKKLL